jgi:hypothetical protein
MAEATVNGRERRAWSLAFAGTDANGSGASSSGSLAPIALHLRRVAASAVWSSPPADTGPDRSSFDITLCPHAVGVAGRRSPLAVDIHVRRCPRAGGVIEFGAGWVPAYLQQVDFAHRGFRRTDPHVSVLTLKPLPAGPSSSRRSGARTSARSFARVATTCSCLRPCASGTAPDLVRCVAHGYGRNRVDLLRKSPCATSR